MKNSINKELVGELDNVELTLGDFFVYSLNYNKIIELIKKGADPNVRNRYGYTILLIALHEIKSPKIIKELLELGADPNIKNDGILITDEENPEIVKLLLEFGGKSSSKNAIRF